MILKLDSKRIQLARQAEQTVHVRFRMYKAKKRWLIAGAALLFIPAFFQPGHEVKADTSSPQTQVTATSQAAEPATSQSAVTSDQATTSSNAVNATNSGEAVKASSAASAASSQTSSSSAAQTLTSQPAVPEQTTDASQVASATSAQVASGSVERLNQPRLQTKLLHRLPLLVKQQHLQPRTAKLPVHSSRPVVKPNRLRQLLLNLQ